MTPRFPRNKVFISASCDRGLPLRDPRGGSGSAPPPSGAVTSVRALQKVNPVYLRRDAAVGAGTTTRAPQHPQPPSVVGVEHGDARRREGNELFGARRRRNTCFATLFAASRAQFTSSGPQETALRLSFTVPCDFFAFVFALKIAAPLASRLSLQTPHLFTSFPHFFPSTFGSFEALRCARTRLLPHSVKIHSFGSTFSTYFQF